MGDRESMTIPSVLISLDGIRLTSPPDPYFEDLAFLIRGGIHDPEFMPFTMPWTDQAPVAAAKSWTDWAQRWGMKSTPAEWLLCFAVLENGRVVGSKSLAARNFLVERTVSTGSWLSRDHQGRGIGTLMRRSVLNLAFNYLGAERATSEAYADNVASCRLNERLGYRKNGTALVPRRGLDSLLNAYVLNRSDWIERFPASATVTGSSNWREWLAGVR